MTTEWLVCSSDKGTIHIFSLKGEKTKGRPVKKGKEEEDKEKAKADDEDAAKLGGGEKKVTEAKEPEESKEVKKEDRKNPTSSLSWAGSILPKYFTSEWSFAQYRVPDSSQTIVAFGEEKNSIIVVSADGVFYKAHFDPDKPNSSCVQAMYTKFVKDATEEAAAVES